MPKQSEISEVKVSVIKPNNGLVGFASIVLDGKLYLGSIGVHSRLDGTGYRITYPTRKVGEQNINVFHPIDRELSLAIERAVVSRMSEVMGIHR